MNDLLKILHLFFKEHKFYVLVYLILLMLYHPINNVVVARTISSFFKNVNESSTNDFYYTYLSYALTVYLILFIIEYSTNNVYSKLIPTFEKYIHDIIYEYILKKYQYEYKLPEIAELLHKIEIIPNVVKNIIEKGITNFLPQIITVLSISAYFFYVNPILGTITFCLILFFIVKSCKNYNTCEPISIKNEKQIEGRDNNLSDKFHNLFSIYSNGKLHDELKENKERSDTFKNVSVDYIKCTNHINNTNSLFNLVMLLGLIILSVVLFKKHKMPHVLLISVILLITYIPDNIVSIGLYIISFMHNYSILRVNSDFISDIYKISTTDERTNKLTISNGKINVTNISFAYPGKENVFTNFSLEIPAKQKVALLGKSGRGKSTLIKIITGYYKVQNGSVSIDDTDISTINLNDLRTNISYIGQNNILFNTSVWENIKYGNNASKEDVKNLIQTLHVENIFGNIDDNVGLLGDKLSGGQKQMIHILRAMLKKNKIVILDEPTSNIDVTHKDIIKNAIKELSKDSTLILITHDESILDLVEKSINIDS
jgi:ABC-type bacteriocin/lantibiotic exporter with double-glycine peptidase domain